MWRNIKNRLECDYLFYHCFIEHSIQQNTNKILSNGLHVYGSLQDMRIV